MSERLEPDDPLGREIARRMAAEGVARRLHAENAAFCASVDRMEAALAGIVDVLNQELRENGGDRFQVNGIGEDMRPAIRILVDRANRRPRRGG